MNWDLELFEYYQDNLQDYQTEINNLNSKISKLEKNSNSIYCSICLDNLPNILYLPCHHITNCEDCSIKHTDFCPICLSKIQNKIKVYYA